MSCASEAELFGAAPESPPLGGPGTVCRVLSGQRHPGVGREQGLEWAAAGITAVLPVARENGVILGLENHYKDGFWKFPEFAQKMDVFVDLVKMIPDRNNFGVQYDPSNAVVAGDDPVELLKAVADRVVSMHASDRYLAEGTIEDVRREEDSVGYAARLRHGVIGEGMNDYDAIFGTLKGAGFDGWISIEDGVEGMEPLRKSVEFLRGKMRQYWG